MRSTFVRAALAAAFITVLSNLAACGGDDGHDHDHVDAGDLIDAAPRQVIMETQALQPGQLVEGIMNGGPNDVAVIHLEAPVSELDWNIHGHSGGSVQTVYEELDKMVVDYVFVPSADTDWWLLLRNSGPSDMTVSVRVELYNDMQWRWQ